MLFIIYLKIKQSPMQCKHLITAFYLINYILIAFKRSLMGGFFLTFVDFILKKVIMYVWKKMRCRFVLIPNFLGAKMSWCQTVFFNGCRNVLVPNCPYCLSFSLHLLVTPSISIKCSFFLFCDHILLCCDRYCWHQQV